MWDEPWNTLRKIEQRFFAVERKREVRSDAQGKECEPEKAIEWHPVVGR